MKQLLTEAAAKRAPKPAEIDALVAEYAAAQQQLAAATTVKDTAKSMADVLKAKLTEMVETYGVRHTEKSKRLFGVRATATTTTATQTSVDPNAVETFRAYLGKEDLVEISGRFFVAHTSYTLVDGPQDVLKTLSLPAKIRNKIADLVGRCFVISTKNPSLKIDLPAAADPKAKAA